MIKGKRGEEYDPMQKAIVLVLIALAIGVIIFILASFFGGIINTWFENIPIFGFGKKVVKNDLGLFRYSFVEASKPDSKSVVQYYDGTTWRDFFLSERNVSNRVIDSNLLRNQFERYFLSLCKNGKIASIDKVVFKATSCGLGPLEFKDASTGKLFNYVEVNNGDYMITGSGEVYAKKYFVEDSLNEAGEVNYNKDAFVQVTLSVNKKEGSIYYDSPTEVKEILDTLDGGTLGYFAGNNVLFIDNINSAQAALDRAENQAKIAEAEFQDLSIYYSERVNAVSRAKTAVDNAKTNLENVKKRSSMYLTCDLSKSSDTAFCEVAFGNAETGLFLEKIPSSKLRIDLKYVKNENRYTFGGKIYTVSKNKGYALLPDREGIKIRNAVFAYLDDGLSTPMEVDAKEKTSSGNEIFSFLYVCVKRSNTDYISDVNKPIKIVKGTDVGSGLPSAFSEYLSNDVSSLKGACASNNVQ